MTDLVTIGFKADTSGLTQAQTQLEKTAAAGKRVDTSLSSLTSTIGALGAAMAALGTARLTSELIDYSDAWKGVTSQIRQVTESEAELNRVRSQVLAVAKETRSELGATVELYTALSRSTSRLGLDSERQLEVTRTLNNLFLSSGKSASESAGAIRQLGQALESGALRGDEFNSVAEGAPRILDALSQSLGMARGELREFAATGGITAGILVDALEGYSEQAQKMADQTEITFGQSMTVATANVTEFVGGLTSVNGAINSFGGGIVSLSENLDALTDAAIAGAGVLGGIYAINTGKAAAANIQQMAAAKAAAAAELNKARAAEATAAAELAAARAVQQRAAGLILNTQATSALTAAETKHTAALAAVSAAQATATTTATALGAAWRFMLGPWGALITAVGLGAAVYATTADSVDELTDSIKDNNDEVDRSLTLYDRYINKTSEARAESLKGMSQEALQEEFDKTAKRVELYEKRLERLKAAGASLARISDLETRLKLDREQLEAITKAAGIAKTSYELLEGEMLKLALSLDPALKASKSMEEGMTTLNDAFAKGLISSKQYGDYVQKLKEKYDPATKAANDKAAALKKVQDRLNPLSVLTRQYYKDVQLLAEDGDIEGVRKLSDEYWGMADALKGVNDESAKLKDNGLSDMLNNVDSLSYGFSNLGNVIADSFGDAAAQLNNFAGRMNEITKQREKLTKLQAEGNLTIEEGQKVTEKLNQLNQEMYATQLGAIGGVLGAAKGMFKEQSKEREALHRLEMGFMVAEMALAAEKAVVNAVAAISNQGNGDPYTAFARIATMSAIMAGVLGAAGIAFSGGSGGYDVGAVQDSQGTGTEFGDSTAKADSLVRLQERFEDIQIDQLSELRGIRDAMGGLSSGIAQLALDIVGTGRIGNYTGDLSGSQSVRGSNLLLGGANAAGAAALGFGLGGVIGAPILLGVDKLLGGVISDVFNSVVGGLFGKTKKKLVDEGLLFEAQEIGELISGGIIDATYFATIETTKKKLFGLSKKKSTKDETAPLADEFSDQIGLIFNYLADSVTGAIDLLGIDTERSINDFLINIGKISLKDMTGEEIQAELEAIFSQQGDLIAKYMWPQVEQYQQLGEGALETLLRVTQEQVAFNDAIENLGLTLEDLDPTQLIDVSQALIELFGGLEGFSESVSEYYDAFFSDAEKLEMLTNDVSEAFASLGIIAPQTKEDFRALVESIDLTTESGRALFAALMEIAPAFAEVIDGWEESRLEEAARLEEERNEAINEAMRNLREAVAVERERADEVLAASREAYNAEKERIEVIIDGLNEELALREQALSDAEAMLRASFNAEAEKIQAASNVRIDALNSEISAINELKNVATAEYEARVQAALDAEQKLTESFNAEMVRLQALSNERIALINEEIAAIDELRSIAADEYKARVDAAKKAESALKSSLDAEVERISAASDRRIESLNEEIAAIDELKNIAAEDYKARVDAAKNAESALKSSLDAEIYRISVASDRRIEALNSEISLINELKGAATAEYEARLQAAKNAESALKSSLDAEVDKISSASVKRIESLNEEIAIIEEMAKRSEQAYNERLANLERADGLLGRAFGAEINSIQDASAARVSALQDEINDINTAARARQSALSNERSRFREIASTMGALADRLRAAVGIGGSTDVLGALIAARRGDFSLAESLEVPTIDAAGFGSASEMQFAQMVQRAQVGEIADLASGRASMAERQLNAIERQTLAVESSSNLQIEAINRQINAEQERAQNQIDALNEQLNALRGIDSSIVSVQAAIRIFTAAQREVGESYYKDEQSRFESQIELLNKQIEEEQKSTANIIIALRDSVSELLGIETSVLSLNDAIGAYMGAQANIDEKGYNALLASYDEQIALLNQQIADDEASTKVQIAELEAQLNALLGIDTSVMSVEDAIKFFQDAQAAIDEEGYNALLESYDEQIALINEQIASEEAATESQIAELEAQLNALLGIDTSVLSLSDAIDAYMDAQAAIDEEGYNALLASYDEQIALLNQQISNEEASTEAQIAELEAQLNALLGIDTSIMSVEDAIKFLQDAQAAIDEAGYNEIISSYDEQIALINEQIANEQASTQAQLTALTEQLNALLGIDTAILNLSDAIKQYQDAKLNLDALNYDEQLEHLEGLLLINEEMLADAVAQHALEMARLDSALEYAEEQINRLKGIDDSVKTVAEALADIKRLAFGVTGGDKKEDDIIIVTPVPIDTWDIMGQQPTTTTISNEVISVLESIARSTATSANNSTRQRTEGQYVRIVE